MQLLNNMYSSFSRMESNRKIALILVLILLISSAFLLTPRNTSSKNIDSFPKNSSSESDYSKLAYINEGSGLYEKLNNSDIYDRVSEDLRIFAVASFPEYNSAGAFVGFKITSKIESKDNIVHFSGRYGANKDKIVVSLQPKNHGRVFVQIINQSTETSIDNFLPTNTQDNIFIGSLPIDKGFYVIDYNEKLDNYTAFIDPLDSDKIPEVIKTIEDGSGKKITSSKMLTLNDISGRKIQSALYCGVYLSCSN